MKVKFILKCLLLILIVAGCATGKKQVNSLAKGYNISYPPEFHERGGLPNFYHKLARSTGKEFKIAYVGGSITESADGWRDLSFSGIRAEHANNSFTQINAAIGGTGSNLGVFRMERDVLQYKPDLVFVEFAVNDDGRPAHQIHRTMEGIVRKIWRAFPETDICFVYTIAQSLSKEISQGKYHATAAAMETLAEYYQIPSIHMGVEVVKLMNEGKLQFSGIPGEHPGKIIFTKDGVHPLTASGHPLYAKTVLKYMKAMQAKVQSKPHVLSAPMVADNLENGKMLTLGDQPSSGNWILLPPDHEVKRRFASFMPSIYKAVTPGAQLKIHFKGKTLGFYDVIGPGTGIIDMTIDGKEKEMYRFDPYCVSYRKHCFFLDSLTDGDHELVIRVTGRSFDKAAVLAKTRQPQTMDDPKRFVENAWYIGGILVGEGSAVIKLE